jgi:toxin FitB
LVGLSSGSSPPASARLGQIDGSRQGQGSRSALDTIIAAVAEANGCVVVTDNERDFPGVETLNPLRAAD